MVVVIIVVVMVVVRSMADFAVLSLPCVKSLMSVVCMRLGERGAPEDGRIGQMCVAVAMMMSALALWPVLLATHV